jgi:hypothetical protein
MVSVNGYLIGSPEANKVPLPPAAELQWWCQYYFATERGRAGYDRYRQDFAKLIWRTASPANGAPHPDSGSYDKKFSGKYTHRMVNGGIGHNLPQEAPQAFAEAVLEVDGY